VAFVLPIELSLSQPMSFLTFTLPIRSLIPPGEMRQTLGEAELPTGIKPWQRYGDLVFSRST